MSGGRDVWSVMRSSIAAVALASALTVLPAAHLAGADARADHWVATWATSLTLVRGTGLGGARASPPAQPPTPPAPAAPPLAPPPGAPSRRFPIPPTLAGVNGQTIRMIVRASLGGRAVRVRLANAFGAESVTIGAARIARSAGKATIDVASSHVLTFSGRPTAVLYAGQVLVSDPVDLAVPALGDLAVSLYVPDKTGTPTGHLFGLRSTYVSAPGDFTGAADITADATMQSYYWLAGVDVLAPPDAGAIVAFGDSITD